MEKNVKDTLYERLQDPEFEAEWEAMERERQIMQAIVMGREEHDLTHSQFADATTKDRN